MAYVKVLGADFLLTPFSHTFPFNNFPLAVLFPSKSFPHQNAQSKSQSPKNPPKPKVKAKDKKQKPPALLQQPFINSSKTGWSRGSGEVGDIVTGETCTPASLNTV
jgi:hypothetical protein